MYYEEDIRTFFVDEYILFFWVRFHWMDQID